MQKHIRTPRTLLVLLVCFFVMPLDTSAQLQEACPNFSTTLSKGMKGDDVIALQTWLIYNGYDIPAISSGVSPKGSYGQATANALSEYQKAQGLAVNGSLGSLTRAKMNATCNPFASSTAATATTTTPLPLAVATPNASETWRYGSEQLITWRTTHLFRFSKPTSFDVFLEALKDCGQVPCVASTYTIAKGLKNVTAHKWIAGTLLEKTAIPDGLYRVRVCMATEGDKIKACDSSDRSFKITATPRGPIVTPTPVLSSTPTPAATNRPIITPTPIVPRPTTTPVPTSTVPPIVRPSPVATTFPTSTATPSPVQTSAPVPVPTSTSAPTPSATGAPVDTTPPVIIAISHLVQGQNSAAITWDTNEFSTSQVEYGPTGAYGTKTPLAVALSTHHSVTVSGLTAGTTYHYRVLSRDSAGNVVVSADFAFTTTVAPTTTPSPTSSPSGSGSPSPAPSPSVTGISYDDSRSVLYGVLRASIFQAIKGYFINI